MITSQTPLKCGYELVTFPSRTELHDGDGLCVACGYGESGYSKVIEWAKLIGVM